MHLSNRAIWRALALAVAALVLLTAMTSAEYAQRFDVEAGEAAKTLKRFAKQAKLSIVYDSEAVKDTRTNEIGGTLKPSVALERMLEGTQLAFVVDEATGAFAVKRSEPPVAEATSNPHVSMNTTDSNDKEKDPRKWRMSKLMSGALAVAISATQASAQDDATEDDVFSLSPFIVEAAEDEGWRSNNTLAGTRFKTDLKDVAAAIDVFTKEFLDDNAIDNLSEAALYASNSEGSLEYTDSADGIDFDNEGQLTKPGSQTRVRGLRAPDRTRNFFTVVSPIDTYNVGRVTFNRGPNAILFGLGSPTGVIESGPFRANYEDGGTLQLKADDLGSNRVALTYNKVLIDEKLAFGFAALRDSEETIFHPTYDRDERLYGTLGFDPFEGTRIDISYERITVDASRSRNWYIPDQLTGWVAAGRPSYNPLTREYKVNGVVTPEAGVGTIGIGIDEMVIATNADGSLASPVAFLRNGGLTNEGRSTGQTAQVRRSGGILENSGGLGFGANQKTSLLDNSLFPVFYNTQNSIFSDDDADILDISLNQRILENLHVEFAYHRESYEQLFLSQGRGDGAAPFIDINEVLLNGDPNPNFGRLAIRSEPFGQREAVDTEVLRGTGSYTLDFTKQDDGWARWLGRHQVAVMLESNDTETRRVRLRERVISDPSVGGDPIYNTGTLLSHGGRRVQRIIYIDDPARPGDLSGLREQAKATLDSFTWNGLLAPASTGVWAPVEGEVVTQFVFDDSPTAQLRTLDSSLGVIQSSFLDGHVVASVGYREDDTTRFSNDWEVGPDGLRIFPDSVTSGEEFEDYSFTTNTRTRGVVVHGAGPLSFLSAHYQESDNFNPEPLRTITGETIDAQVGTGKDYGFSMNLLENKLNVKVNWYENNLENVNNIAVSFIARWRINGFESNIASFFNSALVTGTEWRRDIVEENGLTYRFPTTFTGNIGNRWNAEEMLPARGTEADPDRNVAFLEAIGYTGPTAEFAKSLSGDTRAFTDLSSEGVEIDVSYQITDNWFIKANASQTESINSNVGTGVLDYIDTRMEELWGSMFPHTQRLSDGRTYEEYFANRLILERAELARDLEGLPNPQIREYRVNMNTRYQFSEGRFKGLTVGGAARWRSAASVGFFKALNPVTGNPKFDATRPIEGDDTLEFDGFASYKFKELFGENIDMTLQLNIRNLFDDTDPIAQQAVDVLPNEDVGTAEGIPVTTRYNPKFPRKFILSAKFDF